MRNLEHTFRSSSRRGFSTIELMVASGIGVFVLATTVRMTVDHGTLMSKTGVQTDMYQGARLALDLMAQDIRHAGVGVGYQPDGAFAGFSRGTYAVYGGAQFVSNERSVTLGSGTFGTDDLGVRFASGGVRTVAFFGLGNGQICGGSAIAGGDLVVLASREGLYARTVKIDSISRNAACISGRCLRGCDTFTYSADDSYVSDSGALAVSYEEGEMMGQYQHAVWFVTPRADQVGELRRALINSVTPCAAADSTCGGVVAEGVETLQVALWQWDEDTANWVDRTLDPSLDDRRRIRVDLEMVVRGYVERTSQTHGQVGLALAPAQCVPGPCGSVGDRANRWAIRTSVEVRNSGRLNIR